MTAPVPVGPATTVRLHELSVVRDGGEWLVGRARNQVVVALPEIGVRAIEELAAGRPVAEVENLLGRVAVAADDGTGGNGGRDADDTDGRDADGRDADGRDADGDSGEAPDVAQFVRTLVGLGFVAEVDGAAVPEDPLPRPTFPRLHPHHVGFLLRPVVPWLVAVPVLAAAVLLALRPSLLPHYRDLLWSPHGSLVLVAGLVGGWSIVFLHECVHLAVARAHGLPARITFGTRLQFLVLHTDISGIELAPRRHRLSAYLGGMAFNLLLASVCLLASAVPGLPADALPTRLLRAATLWSLLPVPFEFLVFLRTDVYFALADLARCRDLQGDGRAYALFLARRAGTGLSGLLGMRATGVVPPVDPTAALPRGERRAVRGYTPLMVVGVALCLAFLAWYTVPLDVSLLTGAARRVARPAAGFWSVSDGAVTLLVLSGIQGMWLVTWLRRRGAGMTRWWRGRAGTAEPVGR